jgi:hypothetical protein
MNWSKLALILCQVAMVITTFLGDSTVMAQQQNCGFFEPTIKFKDGVKDCAKSFSFLNRRGLIEGRPSSTYRDLMSGRWAIASTKDTKNCPFATRMAWNLENHDEAGKAESECNENLNKRIRESGVQAVTQGCRCEVLAESGESKLTRDQFVARTSDLLIIADRPPLPLPVPPPKAPDKTVSKPPEDTPKPPQQTPIHVAARRALVVGIDRYRYLPTLTNGRSDASAMAAALRGLGFQVSTSVDTDLQTLKTQIASFAKTINKGDEVAFFFAGHGFGIDSGNYLAAADTKPSEESIKADSIELEWIKKRLNDREAKISLLVIDACRNDPRAVPLQTISRSDLGGGLVPTTPAEGQAIIFSAGYGQKALDRLTSGDSNPNSVFTRIFLEEIVRPDIPIHQMLRKVRERVTEAAASVNRRQVPAIYDEILGDFYFRKTK